PYTTPFGSGLGASVGGVAEDGEEPGGGGGHGGGAPARVEHEGDHGPGGVDGGEDVDPPHPLPGLVGGVGPDDGGGVVGPDAPEDAGSGAEQVDAVEAQPRGGGQCGDVVLDRHLAGPCLPSSCRGHRRT